MHHSELSLYDSVAIIAGKMSEEVFTEPDDDWAPIAFVEDKDGDRMTLPLGEWMGDDRMKDVLTNLILPGAIKHVKAQKVVMILSIWQSETSAQLLRDTDEYIPPSECDDRTEHVMVTEYTREGVTRQAFAQIQRHEESPPTLDEWRELPDAAGYTGRFIEPIVKALKEVRP